MAANGRRRRGEEQAVIGLAAGLTFVEAAERAGVGERTLRRWWADDREFRGRVAELAGEGIDRARRLISAGVPEAAKLLVALAIEPASVTVLNPATRLRAILGLLDRAEAGHRAGLVEDRLQAVEEELGLR